MWSTESARVVWSSEPGVCACITLCAKCMKLRRLWARNKWLAVFCVAPTLLELRICKAITYFQRRVGNFGQLYQWAWHLAHICLVVAYAYDHLTSDSTVKPPLVSSTILLGRGLHAKCDDNVPTPWMPARISLSIPSFMKVQQTFHIESPWLFSAFIFLSDRCQQDYFCLRFLSFSLWMDIGYSRPSLHWVMWMCALPRFHPWQFIVSSVNESRNLDVNAEWRVLRMM